MIAHLVLFRPRPNLTASERRGLIDALTRAISEIPTVRRARVGRRVTHGRPYELLMRADYQYVAILEFDDVAGLQAYLAHPAHDQLAGRFFEAFEEALFYDFDVQDGMAGIAALDAAPPASAGNADIP